MAVFLANRANSQSKRLHDRIQNRLSSEFENVHRRRAEPRKTGPYRVVAEVDPRQFLGADEFPVTVARVDWIEPDRSLLVGWHQDDTHDDLGPVHLQVNDGPTPVAHEPAQFIDSHPLDVVERRLESFQDAVFAVEWEQGCPVGFDTAASVVACSE
jgi:hypothetical protein